MSNDLEPPASAGRRAVLSRTSNAHSRRLAWAAAFTAVLSALFAYPLFGLMLHASKSSLHSHIVLIPFVSAYLLRLRWKALPKEYVSSAMLAAFAALIGFAALAAPYVIRGSGTPLSHNDNLALTTASFVFFLAAGGFLFLGRRWMTAAAFPIAFLLFMIPLPDDAVDALETASKFGSAESASILFSLTQIPVLREQLVFQLPGITVEVAQECSGIRSSWVLFITSVLASNMFLKGPWHRIALVAFVIPLGLLRNGFRIVVIGWLCVEVGPHMIHSIIHRRGGPLFFALSLIPLFLLLWWLRKREVTRAQRLDPGTADR